MSTMPQQPQDGAFAILNAMRLRQMTLRSQEPTIYPPNDTAARSQVICIASGKGGTGKTLIASNLAVVLSRLGLKVSLVDGDFGLANAHIILGMTPSYDVSHLMRGEKTLDEIIARGPGGLYLVPGGSGYSELTLLSENEMAFLAEKLQALENFSDIVIVDLPAGISPQVIRFLNIAHDIILVSNHELAAQADVLATIKMLSDTLGAATVHLVINRARDRKHAVVAFQHIWNHVNRRWRGRIKLYFSGWLPQNWYVQSSILLGKPLVLKHPQSLPSRCLQTIGAKLHKHHMIWKSRQIGRWAVPSAFVQLRHILAG